MNDELPPQYTPGAVEPGLYRWWEGKGLFSPERGKGKGAPFVIMMPPPNVTSILHMGHGLTYTVQDVLTRFERMRGRVTLWLPGTDHAGIATQNVVERIIAQEGKTRFDLGRREFEARVWAFVRETGDTILQQLRALGASADWTRTYFTLDEDPSRAVREVFVRLHEKGLIYRGKYIINWCPRCLTALSNEEVEKEEVDGKIWWFRYPLEDGSGFITVATTRPETMLGDTGVAVNPKDKRYKKLVGKKVRLPLVDRLIPIVADSEVDPKFGSGAVKVTPAHDPLDFDIGRRHHLEPIDIFTHDAHLNDAVPERFRGLDRFVARKQVVAEFEKLGLLDKVENHRHAVGHCYRCETVVEPRLSDQWFVKMAPLAKPALQAYVDGTLRFIPDRRGEEYRQWMEGIRDWCISRQLWWGHRIPVWYCDKCGEMIVAREEPKECSCGAPLRQDEDVLDTWFSSWLVTFSSLGWPDKTKDLDRFYPGSTLVTAPEILFFWVARMVMAGCWFMGEIPFSTVYLHGTVRDTQHRKMSKSLGNGIDPLEVVSRFGADALRYTVISGMAVGTDVILDPSDLETSFSPGRNFANKLWNAGRFVLANLGGSAETREGGKSVPSRREGAVRPLAGNHRGVVKPEELTLADRWIISRCNAMVIQATEAYDKYRLNEAANAVYHFLWSDFADWYIEQIKPRLYGDQPGGDVARAVATRTFEIALQLLHPIMPFITEALWKRLPGRDAEASISISAWPRPDRRANDADAERAFALVQELVVAVRQIRAEYGIEPGKSVRAVVTAAGKDAEKAFHDESGTIRRLAKLSELRFGGDSAGVGASAVLTDRSSLFVPLGEVLDLDKERSRLQSELERLTKLIENQKTKLGNEQFTSRAPQEIVAKEREKLSSWSEQHAVLAEKHRRLVG